MKSRFSIPILVIHYGPTLYRHMTSNPLLQLHLGSLSPPLPIAKCGDVFIAQ